MMVGELCALLICWRRSEMRSRIDLFMWVWHFYFVGVCSLRVFWSYKHGNYTIVASQICWANDNFRHKNKTFLQYATPPSPEMPQLFNSVLSVYKTQQRVMDKLKITDMQGVVVDNGKLKVILTHLVEFYDGFTTFVSSSSSQTWTKLIWRQQKRKNLPKPLKQWPPNSPSKWMQKVAIKWSLMVCFSYNLFCPVSCHGFY